MSIIPIDRISVSDFHTSKIKLNTMMIPTLDRVPKYNDEGTVLIAFMVYIATSLLIWLFTIPSFGLFDPEVIHNTINGHSLESHLEYARDEAIQRKLPVTICVSENGLSCSENNQWAVGWIVFTDSDRDPGQLNPDDKLLHVYSGGKQEVALNINAHYVRYLADGVIELDWPR